MKDTKIMTEATIANFNALRLTLEVQVANPAVIVVTSATEADGTSFAAFGIADSLAAAGHRTLLVRANHTEAAPIQSAFRKLGEERRAPRMIGDHGLLTIDATEERITPAASRDSVGATLRRLRDEFSYIIIDAGVMPGRVIAGTIASLADATLVALRTGRARASADSIVAKAIATTLTNVLGIVGTTRDAIAAFERVELTEHTPKPRFIGVGSVATTV